MTAPARRLWWEKRRWVAAVAVWLASPVLYVLSDGVAAYGEARGWWRYPSAFYEPLDRVVDAYGSSAVVGAYVRYYLWAQDLWARHAASD